MRVGARPSFPGHLPHVTPSQEYLLNRDCGGRPRSQDIWFSSSGGGVSPGVRGGERNSPATKWFVSQLNLQPSLSFFEAGGVRCRTSASRHPFPRVPALRRRCPPPSTHLMTAFFESRGATVLSRTSASRHPFPRVPAQPGPRRPPPLSRYTVFFLRRGRFSGWCAGANGIPPLLSGSCHS